MQAARTIEILRTERGLSQRQLACRVTALGQAPDATETGFRVPSPGAS